MNWAKKASKLSGMSVDEVWNFINEKAKAANLIKIKNGEYHGKGDEKDLGYWYFCSFRDD